ncbi:hypothetical protein HDU67_009118 [Dinochytrium kinnereticum]|nr:hypothetical protein HDU67_009118 [Dinochytrium kinnereticum]
MAPPKPSTDRRSRASKKEDEGPVTFEELLEAATDFEDQGDRYRTNAKARNNYEKACEKYEAAAMLRPEDADVMYNWGRVCLMLAEFEFPSFSLKKRLGFYQKSISCFRSARDLTTPTTIPSQKIDVLFNLAQALQSYAELLDDDDQARESASNLMGLLTEADEVLVAVYEAQEKEFLDQESFEEDAVTACEDDHKHEHEGEAEEPETEGDDEVYVDVEAITASTIIDTLVARIRVLISLNKQSQNGEYFKRAESVIELAVQSWLPKLVETEKEELEKAKDLLDKLAVLPDLGIAAASLARAQAEASLASRAVPTSGGSGSSSSSSAKTLTWTEYWQNGIDLLQRIVDKHPKCAEAACDRGDALVDLAEAHITLTLGSSVIGSRLDLQKRLSIAVNGATPQKPLMDLPGLTDDEKTLITLLRKIYKDASASYVNASRIAPSRGPIHLRLAEIELYRSHLYPILETPSKQDVRLTLISNAEAYYRIALKSVGFKTIPTTYKETDDDETVRLAFLGLARVLSHSATDPTKGVRELLTAWRKWGGYPEDLVDAPMEFSAAVKEQQCIRSSIRNPDADVELREHVAPTADARQKEERVGGDGHGSMGASLLVLLGTSEGNLRQYCALFLHKINTPVGTHLRSLDSFLIRFPDAFKSLYVPLKEKVGIEPHASAIYQRSNYVIPKILLKDQTQRPQSVCLLWWLLHSQHSASIVKAIEADLSHGEKRDKLAAVIVLSDYLKSNTPSFYMGSGSVAYSMDAERLKGQRIWGVMPRLVNVILMDAPLDKATHRPYETRLTTEAAGLAMDLVSLMLESPQKDTSANAQELELASESKDTLLECYENAVLLLEALAKFRDDFSMEKAAITSCIEILGSFPATRDVLGELEFASLWKLISEFIHPKSKRMSTLKAAKKLKMFVESKLDTPLAFFRKLVVTAFIVSDRTKEELKEHLLVPEILQHLMNLISSLSLTKNTPGRSLSFSLLRFLVSIVGLESIEKILEPLLQFLDEGEVREDDAVLESVTGLIAEYTVLHPAYVLPALFGRMDSETQAVRHNALTALSQIFKVCKDLLESEAAPQFSKLRETLTDCLMNRLYDDNIHIRNQSSFLFAYTDPNIIVPRLCAYLNYRDDRKSTYSFRNESLVSPASSEAETPRRTPITPADIYTRKTAPIIANTTTETNTARDSRTERMLRVTKKWAETVDKRLWADIIPRLLSKMYAAPNDAVIIRFVRAVSPSWGSKEVRIAATWCLDVMANQPESTGDGGDSSVEDILFSRLCPMLALKMLPLPAFKEFIDSEVTSIGTESIARTLINEICDRIESQSEFTHVRKVAAELLGHFPPASVCPILKTKCVDVLNRDRTHLIQYYLFSCCSLVASHGLEPGTVFGMVIGFVFCILIRDEDLPEAVSEIVGRGCIESLSLCIRVALASIKPAPKQLITDLDTPLPIPLDDFGMITVFEDVINCVNPFWISTNDAGKGRLMALLEKYPVTYKSFCDKSFKVSVFISNVITTTTKHLHESEMVGNQPDKAQNNGAAMLNLLESTAPILINTYATMLKRSETPGAMVVAAACCQCLFHLVFSLKEEASPFVIDLLRVAMEGLNASESKVRLTSVKLIGACYALPSEHINRIVDPLLLVQVKRAMEAASGIETDPTVREIASKLYMAIHA